MTLLQYDVPLICGRTRVFTLSFVPNRVCEGVRLTEKKDCRLPTCWNTMDYYDDAQPSYAAATADMELQVSSSLDRPLFSSPWSFSPRCPPSAVQT
jgi:hypothetical protein